MFKGFFEFIRQGNVIDLAVAVVIGTAFGAVINALVESVLMPLIASVGQEPDFDDFLVFNILDGPDIRIGVLLTEVVSFLIIAAAIYFVVILPMNKMIQARHAAFGGPEEVEEENITLLKEIRDQLKTQTEVVNPAAFAAAVEAERQLEEAKAEAEQQAAADKSVMGKAKNILWGRD